MTLGFKQLIKGKPSGFVGKIISGLYSAKLIAMEKVIELCRDPNHPLLAEYYVPDSAIKTVVYDLKPKITSIRGHNTRKDGSVIPIRWRAGSLIHFVINNRTKNRFQFAPVIPVKRIQKIVIRHIPLTIPRGKKIPCVWIDGKLFYDMAGINKDKMLQLAINDGFDSIEAFFDYFDGFLDGVIIHWTDLKY